MAAGRGLSLGVPSAQDMMALGARLAACCRGGEVIHLRGPLGAGKTTLVRGLLRALGYEGRVKSPTYTLVESYQAAGLMLHHFDLYRLADPEELAYLGLEEFFGADAVCLVEWPERGGSRLPPADLEVCLTPTTPDERNEVGSERAVTFRVHSARGRALIECFKMHRGREE